MSRAYDTDLDAAPGVDDVKHAVIPRRSEEPPSPLRFDGVGGPREGTLIIESRLDGLSVESLLDLPPVSVVSVEGSLVVHLYFR